MIELRSLLQPSLAAFAALSFACSTPAKKTETPDPTGSGGSQVDGATGDRTGIVAPDAPPPRANRPKYGTFGFDVGGMDRDVKPGDDFFSYANGNWVKQTEIPPDRGTYLTFAILAEAAAIRTRAILDDAMKSAAPAGSDERKIGDFYASFMDEAAIEAKGVTPLAPTFGRIAALKTKQELSKELGASLRNDVDAMNSTDYYSEHVFGLWVAEDMNDTSKYRPYLMQGGLGLPDREYYLANKPKFVEIRKQYTAHVAAMLKLAGIDNPEKRAANVLKLETAIAKVHWTVDATGNVAKANTVWKRTDLARKAPGLDWTAYLEGAGLSQQPTFGVWQASAIAGISKLVASQSLELWKDYLAFHAIQEHASVLPKAFVEQSFAFFGTQLAGTPKLRDRWKRGVEAVNGAIGYAVGKIYVQRHFPASAKGQLDVMVKNVLAAFDQRIDRLEWMSASTKAKAKEKLANFQVGIGYPDKPIDYSALEIVKGDAFGNHERAALFEYKRNIGKLGKPVDRSEWWLTPQTVNALNMPMQNMIIFPAAILEPTFFDPNADAGVNYGAIGGVIGHEIVHGFDDTGALFDAKGNLKNWWTPQDMKQFKARGKALAAQYSKYKPLPDLNLNGEQVLGENIADLAGLSVAYDAYKLSLGGKAAPVLDGFTGDQRFFFGWAQNYRAKFREASLRNAVLTGIHSPGMYRAQTVRNIDAWYTAFGAKEGEGLFLPEKDRVKIW